MKFLLKGLCLMLCFTILLSCNSDDGEDCTKTITIPQFYIVNNQSYSFDITQEVPCDFPEPTEPQLVEPPGLENFTYEVLNFQYTPDTGNNTSRFQFEIKLNNPNDYDVEGVPFLTMDIDGLIISGSYSNLAFESCFAIMANSNCILTYDQEESFNNGAQPANSIQLVDVEYFITN